MIMFIRTAVIWFFLLRLKVGTLAQRLMPSLDENRQYNTVTSSTESQPEIEISLDFAVKFDGVKISTTELVTAADDIGAKTYKCLPYFAAEYADNEAQQATMSTWSPPEAGRPSVIVTEAGGLAGSTSSAADSIKTSGNMVVKPVAGAVRSRSLIKHQVKSIEVVTTTPGKRPKMKPRKKLPEGKSLPYLIVETVGRTSKQVGKSTKILPEADRITDLTAGAGGLGTSTEKIFVKPVDRFVEVRPRAGSVEGFKAGTSTPAKRPGIMSGKKLLQGKCLSYLAAEAADRAAKRSDKPTEISPEAERLPERAAEADELVASTVRAANFDAPFENIVGEPAVRYIKSRSGGEFVTGFTARTTAPTGSANYAKRPNARSNRKQSRGENLAALDADRATRLAVRSKVKRPNGLSEGELTFDLSKLKPTWLNRLVPAAKKARELLISKFKYQ